MNNKIVCFILVIIFQVCTAPPVTKNKNSEAESNNEVTKENGLEDYMEYHRYLKEVVDALESDPKFREKLEKAEEQDIRSGKIAHELEYVSHHVRTRLDEIKRLELERLRHLASKQYDLENGIDTEHAKIPVASRENEHIDHSNPHTFEIEDLKKLIAKSTQDLAEADKKRREEFKEYEMQKEFEKQEKLKNTDEKHRAELEKDYKSKEEKHKSHDPLHHPGSKLQLEEVWEKQDHMEQQEFDPRTFFMIHDLDGNGVWDQNEVKSLFIKELDKMYSEGAPEDDMRERIEEMERMREHVFGEVDKNKDGLINYEEFIDQTRKREFQEDQGWETLDQHKAYTEEEYRNFEKQRIAEIERLVAQGMLPPQPGMPVHYDPQMQGHQQFPPQYHPGQQMPPGQYHPNQVPQVQYRPTQVQYQQRPGQYHPNQGQYQPNGVQGQYANQVPQGQYHSNQVPQGQYHPSQVPQGQYHPSQVPQGQQAPQAQKFNPGQAPQAQIHPQQLPNVQQNAQVHSNQVPQSKPVIQGQPNNASPLNTNEVYSNQVQEQVKKPQLPSTPPKPAQPVPMEVKPVQSQPNVQQQAPPQASQV